MQSQINPHFLFNTLNMLSQLAYMEGADKTAELVFSLAKVMRATLRKSQVLISLTEEVSLVRDYLSIQSARFGDRLLITLDIDEDLHEVRIPILILQPLVENVIVHAVETNPQPCSLSIAIKRNKGRIFITVADDGPGLSDARKGRSEGGLGLTSIKARLQHFFNNDFTFSIENRPVQGVIAIITIPESFEDNADNLSG